MIGGRDSGLCKRRFGTPKVRFSGGSIFLPVDLHSEVWEFPLVHRIKAAVASSIDF
jgi:hypothetical protein